MRTGNSPLRTFARYATLGFLVAATIAISLVNIALPDAAAANWGREDGFWVFPVIAAVAYLVPGIIVLTRSGWHPVGWFLCFIAVGMNFSFGPELAATTALGRWWAWLGDVSTNAVFWAVWSGLALVFPDRLSERPRRGVAWSVLTIDALAVVVYSLKATTTSLADTQIPNPLPFAPVPDGVGEAAGFVPMILLAVVVLDFVLRYRTADSAARLQYRWVASAIVFVAVALVVGIVSTLATGVEDNPGWILIVVGYLLVPLAFMVAILKYRLYSIDKIVSRTITYALVALLVAATYAIPVLVLAELVGGSNELVIAGSTLLAASAFNPLRRRVKHLVDRRFNRSRYESDQVVGQFAIELREETDLASITRGIEGVLAKTVQPDLVGVWMRDSG